MSKLNRLTPRSRSRSERNLGSVRSSLSNSGSSRTLNDPALLINQFGTAKVKPEVQIQTIIKYDRTREKELMEKEKLLNAEILALKKTIAELRAELKESKTTIESLEKKIDSIEKEHEVKVSELIETNEKMEQELKSSRGAVAQLTDELQSTKENFTEIIRMMKESFEQRLKEQKEAHEKELAERDRKMELMKKRVADMLGSKSNERQKQLEELKHDLVERAKEAKDLQHQLRQFTSQPCRKCEKLETLLEEKTLQLRLKEKTLNEIQSTGKKMKAQLLQQEVLVNIMDEREKRMGNTS